jgi:hypothetical protein
MLTGGRSNSLLSCKKGIVVDCKICVPGWNQTVSLKLPAMLLLPISTLVTNHESLLCGSLVSGFRLSLEPLAIVCPAASRMHLDGRGRTPAWLSQSNIVSKRHYQLSNSSSKYRILLRSNTAAPRLSFVRYLVRKKVQPILSRRYN